MNSAPLHSPGLDFTAGALSFPEGPAGSPEPKVKFVKGSRTEGARDKIPSQNSKSKSRAQKGFFLKGKKFL